MLIDTHCHLYSEDFHKDIDEVILRAKEIGVRKILLPNIDEDSFLPMQELVGKDKNFFSSMIGIHPTSVNSDNLNFYKKWIVSNFNESHIAIGEIGIDLYWDKTFLKEQVSLLEFQLELAIEKNLPVVLHVRDAFPEIFSVLSRFERSGLKGVFHCFSGSLSDAEKIINIGFLLGIGGVVTYKKSQLPEVIEKVGLNSVILETDSPYLSPMPRRGKRNEPSYLDYIVQKISEITKLRREEVIDQTGINAVKLFNL